MVREKMGSKSEFLYCNFETILTQGFGKLAELLPPTVINPSLLLVPDCRECLALSGDSGHMMP